MRKTLSFKCLVVLISCRLICLLREMKEGKSNNSSISQTSRNLSKGSGKVERSADSIDRLSGSESSLWPVAGSQY